MNVKSQIAAALLTTSVGQMPADAATANAASPAAITGTWPVEWRECTNPNLYRGGLNLNLFQEGARLCGDFGGALINLQQIDDGHVVGTIVGDTVVLAVESSGNGSIRLVRVERHGDTLKSRCRQHTQR